MKTFIAILGFVIAGWVGEGIAQNRVALVVGNSGYESIPALNNPKNDAELISSTLSKLGFDVTTKLDLPYQEMKVAIRDFGDKLNKVGDDGVGLFYYAGHGLQLAGQNHIVPTDAVISKEGDVDIETINANAVLSMMEYSKTRLNFVILDACRDNPYASSFRSLSRGLAQMNASTGTLIAYATSPGEVAADGADRHSPYTLALVESMGIKGIEVEKMFRLVRNKVRQLTNDKQTPWESSSLTGNSFYFNGDSNNTEIASNNVSTPSTIAEQLSQIEIEYWDTISDSDDAEEIQSYIDQFPNGYFIRLAKIRLKKLTKAAEQIALVTNETEAQPTAPEPATENEQPVSRSSVASIDQIRNLNRAITIALLPIDEGSAKLDGRRNIYTAKKSYARVVSKVIHKRNRLKMPWTSMKLRVSLGSEFIPQNIMTPIDASRLYRDGKPNLELATRIGNDLEVDAVMMFSVSLQGVLDSMKVYLIDIATQNIYQSQRKGGCLGCPNGGDTKGQLTKAITGAIDQYLGY